MPEIPNRVLIVEDEKISLHLLDRILGGSGFEVVAVEDGEAALNILQSDDAPSLAILDLMIPKVDGVDVCSRVRQRTDRPYTYIVMLTALTKSHEVAKGLNAGADDYLKKPYDSDELLSRLRVGQRVVMLERTLKRRIKELQNALADVKKLKQLLPICMYCKSIPDDKDYWRQMEEYIHTETGVDFSHGICPGCMEKVQAGLDRNDKAKL